MSPTPGSRVPRFYTPGGNGTAMEVGALVTLPHDEATHLTRTLRLDAGAPVRLFDGRGHEFEGRVEVASRQRVEVLLNRAIDPVPEPRIAVTLAAAVLKGGGFDTIVRDATMLGVVAIQPILTHHTDVARRAAHTPALDRRWRRIAIASAKQSRRAVVPEIGPVLDYDEHLERTDGTSHLLLVEPEHPSVEPAHSSSEHPPPVPSTVSVGPEGGWTETEVTTALERGGRLLTFGRLTWRAETAPLAALAILRFAWRDL